MNPSGVSAVRPSDSDKALKTFLLNYTNRIAATFPFLRTEKAKVYKFARSSKLSFASLSS